jgi:hypothetical protein
MMQSGPRAGVRSAHGGQGVDLPLSGESSARRLGLTLAVWGAALVGYLGLGLTLWQIVPGVLIQVLYVETTALLSLAGFTLYQASYVSKLERPTWT